MVGKGTWDNFFFLKKRKEEREKRKKEKKRDGKMWRVEGAGELLWLRFLEITKPHPH